MTAMQKVSHYGTVSFGDVQCEAVVLEDGSRGFVQRQFSQLLGYTGKNRSIQFVGFLTKISPNSLNAWEKSGYSRISMPHGGHAGFIPAEVVMDMVDGVVEAALDGRLHHKQKPALVACRRIQKATAKLGMIALIDEATGYQAYRAPDALQQLLKALLRDEPEAWVRRFHPAYYFSLMRLMGKRYTKHTALPAWIGRVTSKWVYGAVFPKEIVVALRDRRNAKSTSDKLHQWLSAGGQKLLEQQADRVTTIASSSATTKDFEARCTQAFNMKGQVQLVYPMPQAA